jgi:ankyrin repeat protein
VATTGNESVLRYLVKQGLDFNQTIPFLDCNLMQAAAEAGHRSIITTLLELGADINGPPGEEGCILWYGAVSKDVGMVQFLFSHGAKIDESVGRGSIISVAIHAGNHDLVATLIERGADVNKFSEGYSPLARALQKKLEHLTELLLSHGARLSMNDVPCLMSTTQTGTPEDVMQLLHMGMDPTIRNSRRSPLDVSILLIKPSTFPCTYQVQNRWPSGAERSK